MSLFVKVKKSLLKLSRGLPPGVSLLCSAILLIVKRASLVMAFRLASVIENQNAPAPPLLLSTSVVNCRSEIHTSVSPRIQDLDAYRIDFSHAGFRISFCITTQFRGVS